MAEHVYDHRKPEVQFSFSGNLEGLRALAGIFRGEDPELAESLAKLEASVVRVEDLATVPPDPPSLKE